MSEEDASIISLVQAILDKALKIVSILRAIAYRVFSHCNSLQAKSIPCERRLNHAIVLEEG